MFVGVPSFFFFAQPCMTNFCTPCQDVVSQLRPLFAHDILDRYGHARSHRRQSLAFIQNTGGSLAESYATCNRHRRRQMTSQIFSMVLWGHGIAGRRHADGSEGYTTKKDQPRNERNIVERDLDRD